MHLYIIGNVPPPRGGVTTHIERLLPYLEKNRVRYTLLDHSLTRKAPSHNVISLRFKDARSIKRLITFIRDRDKSIYCPISSVSVVKVCFILLLKLSGARINVMCAGSMHQTTEDSVLGRILLNIVIRLSDKAIIPNADFYRHVMEGKVRYTEIVNMSIYVPSVGEKRASVLRKDVAEFANNFEQIILSYAHGPDLFQDVDLYGLDLLVDLGERIQVDYAGVGIIITIPEILDVTYYESLQEDIRNRDIKNIYVAIGYDIEFDSLLDVSAIFIRATNTDGDSLSVRDALYRGVRCIASDAVPRPEGCVLFQSRQPKDLFAVVSNELKTLEKHPERYYKTDNGDLIVNTIMRNRR